MNSMLVRIWRLLKLCTAAPGGRIGILYFLIVLALNLAGIEVTLRLISWSADFYNALQKLDGAEAVRQIGVFAILTVIGSGLYLSATYIRKLLQICWRQTLTDAALSRWLDNKAYWHVGETGQPVLDNPDQRIAEDCRIFVMRVTEEALDMISAVVGLISYVAVLWQLSSFPLSLTLFGIAVEIPHYMVWAAPVYVAICSGMTHILGAPLMRLNVEQQKREANFRFALTRFREAKEAVALASGETVERAIMDERFRRIISNWRRLIGRELILGCFTRPYMSTVLRIPMFLALPAFLAGHVTLGGLMQLASAFQNVVTKLSWFIFSYGELAELAAASARLDGFLTQMEEVGARSRSSARLVSDNQVLSIHDLKVRDPQGNVLVSLPRLRVRQGETVWMNGPSGLGKSTLIKAIAGLWPHYEGHIETPAGRQFYMAQKTYLPLGSFASAATYPLSPVEVGDVRRLLQRVGLPPHVIRADSDVPENGKESAFNLSGGELQRIAIARILAARPAWVFLDEATSALDARAEEELLSLLRNELPDAAFIVVAHREPVGLGPLRQVDMERAPRQSAFRTGQGDITPVPA